MKIGIISDSPTLTTGFGITTYHIAHGLIDAGHDVVCFGLKANDEIYDRDRFPFKIWKVRIDLDWATLLARFVEEERCDAILINMDIFNLKEVLTYCQSSSWDGPVIIYLILDGVPAYKEYLEVLSMGHAFIVTTHAGANYLRACGIPEVAIAPPGVDPKVFSPLPEAKSLRRAAGLEGKFVVGVFGRNTERKQQARVLTALSHLKDSGRDADILLYFHCQPRAYWHLDEIAGELGVENRLLLTKDLSDETVGVPYEVERRNPFEVNSLTERNSKPGIPGHYSYVERINCCDLIINVAHCGDFEQVIIEAQSCGIPLAATDDRGIMAEAMGDGGLLLEPADVSFWKAGQKNFYVSTQAIAEAIFSVKQDIHLRTALIEKGFKNARRYTWNNMREVMVNTIAKLKVNP